MGTHHPRAPVAGVGTQGREQHLARLLLALPVV